MFFKYQQRKLPLKTRRTYRQSFRRYFSFYLIIILLVISFWGGQIWGQRRGIEQAQQESGGKVLEKEESLPDYLSEDVDFDLFWDVWNMVREEYIESPVPETQLFYGALAGIVAALRDPYSVFLNPETSEKFTNELSGSFEGIGAEIAIKNNRLTIVAPLPGTPAEQAGLRPKDQVLAIDGLNTTGIALDYAVNLIRGEKDTDVILTIMREGLEQPENFTVTRGKIEIKSVKWEMKEGNIAYIDIYHFNSDTEKLFGEAVQDVLLKNPKGIILDLRNNPGGFFSTSIRVASEWVDGKAVVIERFGDGTEREYKGVSKARLKDFSTVVLINGGSASSSEIVAGALQDHKRATLVGEKTFGKGSVQQLKSLKDGSSLKLTIAKWLTPNSISIEDEGITPDIEVDLTKEDFDNDRDPQLDKALELLRD